MKNKFASNIFMLSLICLFVLTASGCKSKESEAIDRYLESDLKKINIEQNIDESGTKLKALVIECQNAMENDEEIDWRSQEPRFEEILKSMEEKKDDISKLDIQEEGIKKINSYLLQAYEEIIGGYRDIIKGYKEKDESLLKNGQGKLIQAQENITTWKKLLNEK